MGGGQSQERVVGVEEQVGAEGQPQIIVTEDFLRHLDDKQPDDDRRSGDPRLDSHDDNYEEDVPFVSAEELLTGQSGAESADHSREDQELKWKRRYELERQKNHSLKNISSGEFEKTVNQVRKKFAEKTRQNIVPICEDCKDKVMECYHSNPGKSLNCSAEVKEYIQCVENARKGLLQPSPST